MFGRRLEDVWGREAAARYLMTEERWTTIRARMKGEAIAVEERRSEEREGGEERQRAIEGKLEEGLGIFRAGIGSWEVRGRCRIRGGMVVEG